MSCRVKNVQHVPYELHARYAAKSRTYLYRFAVIKPECALEALSSKTYHRQPTPIVEKHRCYFVK
jgi:tRNA U38,U39,U40 pseudouridine synthase TruA